MPNPLQKRTAVGYQQGVDIYGFAMPKGVDIFVLCLKSFQVDFTKT